jgi:hypothetical protein
MMLVFTLIVSVFHLGFDPGCFGFDPGKQLTSLGDQRLRFIMWPYRFGKQPTVLGDQ